MSKYLIPLTLAAVLALALSPVAQPQAFDPDEALTQPVRTVDDPELITFSTDVQLVSVPVVVQGKKGQYVNGLEKTDFLLYDNDVQQEILEFDVSFQPISMVICVQSSDRLAADMLDQVKKTAYLFTQQVLGEFGEAAIIGFDSRVKIISEFSSDTKEINKALNSIRTGASGIRVSDAVYEGIRMLRRKPETHKRVIVVIAEGQDNGSSIGLGETLRTAQLSGIQIYPIYLSTLKSRLKAPPMPKGSPYPPGIDPIGAAPGSVSTPTTQQQSSYVITPNVLPLIVDLVIGVKNLLFDDALEILAVGTGGDTYKPLTSEGLQEAIIKIGEDLHSQYLLTYAPNNLNNSGIFHAIRVQVPYDGATVRARPGYFFGPRPVASGDPAP
jgi:VWFA-related protein